MHTSTRTLLRRRQDQLAGKSTLQLKKKSVPELNDQPSYIKLFRERLLQPDAMQPVDLQHLDEIMERANTRSLTAGIDVNKMVTTLRGKGVY